MLKKLKKLKKIVKQSQEFIKQSFKQNGFVAWNMVYLFLVIYFREYFLAIFRVYGITIGLIVFLTIPVLLYIRQSRILAKNNEKQNKQNQTNRLSSQQIKYFADLLPSSQLELLQNVFLVSLNMLHAELSAKELGKNEHGITITLFDKKFAEVCQILGKLRSIPGIFSPETKTRDAALIVFVFYRILFSDVIVDLDQKDQKKGYGSDRWVLLKRLPLSRLLLYLGSQSWRLYELRQIIYGDLNSLELNHDLIEILKQVCLEEIKEIKKIEKIKEPKKIIASIEPTSQEQPQEILEDKNQAKEPQQPQEKPQEPPQKALPKKSIKKAQAKPEPTEPKATPEFSLEQKIAKKFTGWLCTKIGGKDKRYRLNNGDLVFSQSLKYGCDCVFVSEHLLNKYQSIQGIAASELKQALLAAGLTDGKNYTTLNDGRDIFLTKIKDIPISQEDLAVVIEEE